MVFQGTLGQARPISPLTPDITDRNACATDVNWCIVLAMSKDRNFELRPFYAGLVVVLIFLFMDFFDSIGTFIGIGQAGGFLRNGKLPRATRALCADATGTVVGAAVGTSAVTSYTVSYTHLTLPTN